MAVLKSRNRLVTFRLTDDEWLSLKRVCVKESARSISDFARDAVIHKMMMSGTIGRSLGDDLATLKMGLQQLDESLSDLRGKIARILGTREAEPLKANNGINGVVS